jgi:soluble lytic murein transglycosylase-like protein
MNGVRLLRIDKMIHEMKVLASMALAAAISVGAWLAGAARADIYAFNDANGVIHYSNVPTDSRYSLVVREPYPDPGLDSAAAGPARTGRHDPYGALVKQVAHEHKLDHSLLRAIIAVESGNNPSAVSRKGAVGLMQLMPETAARYGVIDLYDPAENVRAGALYLRDLMQKFDNDLSLALAAYNAGEGAILRHGKQIPPYRETRRYVPKVMDLYRQYQPDSR